LHCCFDLLRHPNQRWAWSGKNWYIYFHVIIWQSSRVRPYLWWKINFGMDFYFTANILAIDRLIIVFLRHHFINDYSISQWFLTFSLPRLLFKQLSFVWSPPDFLNKDIGRNTFSFKNFPCCRTRKSSRPGRNLLTPPWLRTIALSCNGTAKIACSCILCVFIILSWHWDYQPSCLAIYLLMHRIPLKMLPLRFYGWAKRGAADSAGFRWKWNPETFFCADAERRGILGGVNSDILELGGANIPGDGADAESNMSHCPSLVAYLSSFFTLFLSFSHTKQVARFSGCCFMLNPSLAIVRSHIV